MFLFVVSIDDISSVVCDVIVVTCCTVIDIWLISLEEEIIEDLAYKKLSSLYSDWINNFLGLS